MEQSLEIFKEANDQKTGKHIEKSILLRGHPIIYHCTRFEKTFNKTTGSENRDWHD